MTRIFGDYIYSDAPRQGCFWDTTCDVPNVPALDDSRVVDVAIIGAGFTGLNAALTLAEGGAQVVVLDAHAPGWGASGRNGGFCCLGGGMAEDAALDTKFGRDERLNWRATEKAAVEQVARFLDEVGVGADRHSNGETVLAHHARAMRHFEDHARAVEDNYGVTPVIHTPAELDRLGLSAGFHGGMTLPIGFALNPRKYIGALLQKCLDAGVDVFQGAQISTLSRTGGQWRLVAGDHTILAEQVIVATNGYSSEHIPRWLSARYMPTQSNVIVTRPLTDAELAEQGWTSHQMCFDSRSLLHYFHLLPDKRMLFGMRGGLGGTAGSNDRAIVRLMRDFRKMFPAWQAVEATHSWSGLVCIARNRMPFVGPVPNRPGLWCAMAFHGNGIAMGGLAGQLVGHAVLKNDSRDIPKPMAEPLARFPYGRFRRILMPLVYGTLTLADL